MYRFYLAVIMTILFVGIGEATAQRIPGYTRRPTISPYIQLFNSNQGGINNYFSFVRPMQQQMQMNQQQAVENRYLQQQVIDNRAAMMGGINPLDPVAGQGMMRPSNVGVGQPSVSATYFNYSHYFNQPVNMQQSLGPPARQRFR